MRRVFAAFAVLCLAGGMASAGLISSNRTAPPGFDPGTGREQFVEGDSSPPGSAITVIGVESRVIGAARVVVAPAPGTIILAAIGTGLVGWLARRRIL